MSDRLRKARADAGYKYASEAAKAMNVTPSTYRAHENGQNNFSFEEAEHYARRFDVSPVWLMTGKNGEPPKNIEILSISSTSPTPNATIGAKVVGLGRKIPVFGQAVGGVDGEFIMNGNILFEVMAPPIISHISNAYAVSVSGDSMSPRYEDGEVCYVDPTRRVKAGDYVIAQIRREEDGPILAFVKKFKRHNSSGLILSQFNPERELHFPHNEVVSVHYIALAGVA